MCLLWNVIAVTAAWIKGEGEFRYIKEGFIRLFSSSNYKSDIQNPIHVNHGFVWCRCEDMVSGHYLLHSRGTGSICSVVSSIISCF